MTATAHLAGPWHGGTSGLVRDDPIPRQRDPHHDTPAGTSSNGRVDRIYLTRELAGAASRHSQQDIGDSDHRALMLVLDGPRAARAIPPEPRR